VSNPTGAAEALLGLPGFRILEMTETRGQTGDRRGATVVADGSSEWRSNVSRPPEAGRCPARLLRHHPPSEDGIGGFASA